MNVLWCCAPPELRVLGLAHRWYQVWDCTVLALGSWHAFWVLLSPQAGQAQPSSQYPSVQSHHQRWHQALHISWPPSVLVPAWHFPERSLCRVPADISEQKLSPSWEGNRPQCGTSGDDG